MSDPTGIKKGVVRAYQVLYEKYIGDFGKEYENCMQSDDNYACTSLAFVETKRLWRRSHKEIASIAGNPDLDVRDLYIHHIRKNKTYAPCPSMYTPMTARIIMVNL